MSQIALAGGFEAAGPLFDKFKDAFGGCLIPGLTKVTVTASIDGALSTAKDLASASLATTPGVSGGASLLEAIYAFFAFFNMDDKTFIERYVVVPV